MAKEYAKEYQCLDPWDLPPYFVLRKNKKNKSMLTDSGYWKEKEEELTAIRSAGESSSSTSPSYVGVRKTLEFYLRNDSKTDWIIHEYHHLRKDEDGEDLFPQEDVVVRKVFNKCKNQTDDEAYSLYRQEVESCIKAYNKPKQVDRFQDDIFSSSLANTLLSFGCGIQRSKAIPRENLIRSCHGTMHEIAFNMATRSVSSAGQSGWSEMV